MHYFKSTTDVLTRFLSWELQHRNAGKRGKQWIFPTLSQLFEGDTKAHSTLTCGEGSGKQQDPIQTNITVQVWNWIIIFSCAATLYFNPLSFFFFVKIRTATIFQSITFFFWLFVKVQSEIIEQNPSKLSSNQLTQSKPSLTKPSQIEQTKPDMARS